VAAGVEKGNEYARERVKRTNVRAFVPIAAQTGQGQIVITGFPTVLQWDNVIRFVLMKRCRLRQQAILAAVGGALRDQSAQTVWDFR
jgi:hypothetical protein